MAQSTKCESVASARAVCCVQFNGPTALLTCAAFFLFRIALAMDGIDRYNHTHAVGFFFFLAFTSLLIPAMLPSSGITGGKEHPQRPQKSTLKAKATCWTPAQFEDSHVMYTNKVCAEIANGSPDHNSGLFKDINSDDIFGQPPLHYTKVKRPTEPPPGKESTPKNQRVDPPGNQTTRLVGYKTPLVLLLLGLCLKLPHLLWTLASNASSSVINVDKVLGSYLACQASDPVTQRQVHQDTAQAVEDSVRLSRNTTSTLYLLLKVLSVIVVIVEIICLSFFVLPEIHRMEMQQLENSASNGHDAKHKAEVAQGSAVNGTEAETETRSPSTDPFVYPNNVFHCFFQIRQLNNVHDYTVQCILFYEEEVSPSNQAKPSGTVLDPLLLYQALFTAVIAVLAVLLFANVVNTAGWFIKLVFSSNRTSLGLPSNAAMDLVLLVHMARINAGPGVARALAGSFAASSQMQEGNREALMKAGVS